MSKKRTEQRAVEGLVAEFLTASAPYSLREAAALSGMNHETIAQLRRGETPRLHPATQRRMREFLTRGERQEPSTVSHGTVERAALLLAADRLERIAAQLRAEAMAPPPREAVTQAKRVAAAVKEVQRGNPGKRTARKESGSHR